MIKEIRIYVEGGGDKKDTKSQFRNGMGEFLKELREAARHHQISWNLIACGSRNSTFEDFCNALVSHPEAFNVLLVDAEGSVQAPQPTVHLEKQDGWDMENIVDEQCYLMVEMMENWFLADANTLADFYKQGFNRNALPSRLNVEENSKDSVDRALRDATQNTLKGRYHKIKHGAALLGKIRPDLVRQRAPNCERAPRLIQFFNS